MPRLLLSLAALLLVPTWLSPAAAAPTPAQRCEADVELASAKFAQCRLTAEAKDSKSPDAGRRAAALARCSDKLSVAFAKAVARYGLNCTSVPVADFDAYLNQCSDDAAAAAAGAALPDYAGDLASCNADLTTCDGGLTTCTGDLATTTADLGTCEGDLASCEARPRLLKTGQTTSYGPGSDGDLQHGLGQNYIDNGDGTITDTRTGLMWEKKSDDDSIHDKDNDYTWSGAPFGTTNALDGTVATTFLAGLNAGIGFAGYTDWRLPNLKELESLVNLGAVDPATFPAFNSGCIPGCTVTSCSCTLLGGLWSSTTYLSDDKAVWGVDFHSGGTSPGYKVYSAYARAVRGGS